MDGRDVYDQNFVCPARILEFSCCWSCCCQGGKALAAAGVCVRMCVCAHAHLCACMSVSFMRMHKNVKCHSFSSTVLLARWRQGRV